MVKNDKSPTPLQRLKHVVENLFWFGEFMVCVRYEHRVSHNRLKVRIVWLSMDDLDIVLISQERSYPQEEQRLRQNIHSDDAATLAYDGTEFECEVPHSRAEINYSVPFLEGECLNYIFGSLP